jgi:hypothetical protein
LLAEYLGRLGVGEFALVDPERVAFSNLPRLTAALRLDAMARLADPNKPAWLSGLAGRLRNSGSVCGRDCAYDFNWRLKRVLIQTLR